jgi:pyruvate formate lyase activating enzyme
MDGERGIAGAAKNQKVYNTLIYGRLCAINNDPIEKKPLFHFLPGTKSLSVATPGCNLKCKFCQNWNISQVAPEEVPFEYYSPEKLVDLALKIKSPSIAFTYTEPTIATEYILDTARAARAKGIHSVMISNGYINSEPLRDFVGAVAIMMDFKAFSDEFIAMSLTVHCKTVDGTTLRQIRKAMPGWKSST